MCGAERFGLEFAEGFALGFDEAFDLGFSESFVLGFVEAFALGFAGGFAHLHFGAGWASRRRMNRHHHRQHTGVVHHHRHQHTGVSRRLDQRSCWIEKEY